MQKDHIPTFTIINKDFNIVKSANSVSQVIFKTDFLLINSN